MESDSEGRRRDELRLGELQFKNDKLVWEIDELSLKLTKL